jgi:hypothetical protein
VLVSGEGVRWLRISNQHIFVLNIISCLQLVIIKSELVSYYVTLNL